jgi:hypothetical protein
MNRILSYIMLSMLCLQQITVYSQDQTASQIPVAATSIIQNAPAASDAQKPAIAPSLHPVSPSGSTEATPGRPELIPFNLVLFHAYCTRMAQRIENQEFSYLQSAVLSLLVLAPLCIPIVNKGLWGLYTFGLSGTAKSILLGAKHAIVALPSSIQDFDSAYNAFASVYKWTFPAYCLSTPLAAFALNAHALFSRNFTQEQDEWENKKLLPVDQQVALWNTIVYEKFGKPEEIVGTIPAHGNYQLKLNKKYGVGQVTINPFDYEQIEIILGIHSSKRDDVRCSTLIIESSI